MSISSIKFSESGGGKENLLMKTIGIMISTKGTNQMMKSTQTD